MKAHHLIVRLGAMTLVLLMTACSGLESGLMSATGTAAANQATGKKSASDPKNLPDVKEFGDVMIPREMDIDKDASFIYTRSGLNAGLLRLSGRVESKSLMRYFQTNMANEGWRMASQFHAPQSLMMFEKENRVCLILLEDATFQTFVDVWVVPRNETLDYAPPK
ncbi:MAG: hypothetical protein MUC33_08830 [Desulfobacterales bacterium]|jgi:hypothetical protein|nr:hypothetical protein [Desulfobacterales bacterium]